MELGPRAREEIRSRLIEADAGALSEGDSELLWRFFRGIPEVWEVTSSEVIPVDAMYGQWSEFIGTRCSVEPSYLGEYESAASVLTELYGDHGTAETNRFVYLEAAPAPDEPTTRLEHLQKYVAAEFVEVYLATGGFREFGAANYKGFVAGSRFRRVKPFRSAPNGGNRVL